MQMSCGGVSGGELVELALGKCDLEFKARLEIRGPHDTGGPVADMRGASARSSNSRRSAEKVSILAPWSERSTTRHNARSRPPRPTFASSETGARHGAPPGPKNRWFEFCGEAVFARRDHRANLGRHG
ncbi:hypothetical protein DdX_22330 [Ditylenchus destructor]|uniref:Uncharacterized protein n=1 Tax=Ditylenchus destructor TaxID=166010 RepID=A0AAD4QUJ1_9BILA|nr:hypothetical protein DdX_22330 [Ditylenchus destructor]